MKAEDIINKTDEIIASASPIQGQVIPLLQAIQKEYNYLPELALQHVHNKTGISYSTILGIATFYSQFRLHPAGKHIIKVCVGTACHVKGAGLVFDAFKRHLKIDAHSDTDQDGLFTIEKVACLGCCTIAPVVQIDEITFGKVSTDKIKDTLEEFINLQLQETTNIKTTSTTLKKEAGEIRIGLGSCCVASGSAEVKKELEASLLRNRVQVDVKQVGCVGVCNQVPMLEIHKPGKKPAFYAKIRPDEVNKIIKKHFRSSNITQHLKNSFYDTFDRILERDIPISTSFYDPNDKDTPLAAFLDGQISIATENRGEMDPLDLNTYKQFGGFKSLLHCLRKMNPDQIIEEILKSGLRGRGGAGFETGRKWKFVSAAIADKKYVICNGDEGDPGAFMDRMLLESYPFRIIEGITIAAFAAGSNEGIFYIRAEYPLAVKRIREAVNKCYDAGLLGNNILNSNFSFHISIFEGAGAFVCGEETALIASIEGKRGLPRLRPPYPAQSGLYEKPTLINNVETLALVPWIISKGADAFKNIGTQNSKGTKVFALAGKINRGGLIEVPMGISIKKIVFDIGGGIQNNKKFKAIQIGGPSGGCIPASLIDTEIDYQSLAQAGAMMGSGGLIVLDETDCMVDIARYFLSFTQDQSCGRCTFCRVGTTRMLEIMDNICSGKAEMNDLQKLEDLALIVKKGSICGLGKTAPNPVLSTLKYFREEYEAHINGKCPTGKCTAMTEYFITNDCIGCTKCVQQCPVDAISFMPQEVHIIDSEKCIQCDACRQICPVDAVITK